MSRHVHSRKFVLEQAKREKRKRKEREKRLRRLTATVHMIPEANG
jgi:hypothetical protein